MEHLFEIVVITLLSAIVIVAVYIYKSAKGGTSKEDEKSDLKKYGEIEALLNAAVDRSLEQQKEIFQGKDSQIRDSVAAFQTAVEENTKATSNMNINIEDFSKVLGADSRIAGQFGEWQLENLFTNRNLVEGVDYKLQVSAKTKEGKLYKPDAILISNDKCIIIDSKATADLGETIKELMNNETSEERKLEIKNIVASRVKERAKELAKKEYQNLVFEDKYTTPQFVVMFVPSENVYFIVKELLLSNDSNSIEKGVLLAGPDNMNFIVIMWAYISRVIKMQNSASKITQTAEDIHRHFSNAVSSFEDLRNSIDKAVKNWGALQKTMDKRLIPAVKKLEALGVLSTKGELPEETGEIIETTKPMEKLQEKSEENDLN
ncbi:MAG TPA: DNA recombination protein RmuC [Candidatus Dadabacteria bacterium]|nr:DNA recombination protein RmuC [Candidatus Dadabacteria bacterium]